MFIIKGILQLRVIFKAVSFVIGCALLYPRIYNHLADSALFVILSLYGFVTIRRQRYGEVMYHTILLEYLRSQEMKSQKRRRLV